MMSSLPASNVAKRNIDYTDEAKLNLSRDETMKKTVYVLTAIVTLLTAACGKGPTTPLKNDAVKMEAKSESDKMIYGLACDGSSDSVIVMLPFSTDGTSDYPDPVRYNIVNAVKQHQVFGQPEIGDWVGVLLNPKKKNEAKMVIDLDQLKGTWTYQVLPTLKEMATKTEGQIIAELTDSMKEELFIPREYGFTLKRQHQAGSVGHIRSANSLSDESLVEYPPVRRFTSWKTFNGKLILTEDTVDDKHARIPENKIVRDTAEFVYMMDDSLALRIRGKVIGFHRQANAIEANKKANEAVSKQAAKDSIK